MALRRPSRLSHELAHGARPQMLVVLISRAVNGPWVGAAGIIRDLEGSTRDLMSPEVHNTCYQNFCRSKWRINRSNAGGIY